MTNERTERLAHRVDRAVRAAGVYWFRDGRGWTMSEMKALDKLRNLKTFGSVKVNGDLVTTNMPMACATMGEINEIADEIEAEIADNYMRLPVDADGVPIHVGDVLECNANGYEGAFTVFTIGNNIVVGNHDIEWIGDNPSKWFHVASFCHHVKPRTLEDVLEDYVVEYQTRHARSEFGAEHFDHVDVDEMIKRCADEIRELLGFEIDEPDTIRNELLGGDA